MMVRVVNGTFVQAACFTIKLYENETKANFLLQVLRVHLTASFCGTKTLSVANLKVLKNLYFAPE